jgi:hypothetical protein
VGGEEETVETVNTDLIYEEGTPSASNHAVISR